MPSSYALIGAACLLGAGSGTCISLYISRRRAAARRRRRSRSILLGEPDAGRQGKSQNGLPARIIDFLCARSRALALSPRQAVFSKGIWGWGKRRFEALVVKTGLAAQVSVAGFLDVRARLALAGAALGILAGLLFSTELAALSGACLLFIGWQAPIRALKKESQDRKAELENHLSEMIEVISLGLRSGLSFDSSFELYHTHFPTSLALESRSAQQQWQMGLATREEVLRRLSASYDSLLFARVIENIVRSLRFGSSLAESLEASAAEARTIHKAHMEEKVAKAPVKMLVPTAALILPAMLLLVLGPILLELIKGF